MKPAAFPTRRTLWRHLLTWTLGAQLAVWLVLVAVAWSTSFRETRKFTDGHLIAVAQLWLTSAPFTQGAGLNNLPVVKDNTHEYAQDVAVIVWEDGRLVTDSHQLAGGLELKAVPAKGLVSLVFKDTQGAAHDWRAYVETFSHLDHERRVAALIDMRQRYGLAMDIAEHITEPAILLLPLVALVLWWTIRRGLRPLDLLSDEVAALDGFAGQRLDTQHRFSEFSSTVSAINTMVDTLQSQAERERQFASDVAHELRTPLAVITLQARAAQAEPSVERLTQLEHEALRAGRILTQLLDLARAQRASDSPGAHAAEAPQSTALGEVAVRLISSHAQLAHEHQHEISFVEPDAPVRVMVQPMLLELALRNLIENALRHTPSGTQVEVVVWQGPQRLGISVCDDGQRADASGSAAQASSGLGLGLRLVERIAEQMGARLERDSGEPPMTTRFTLSWARPVTGDGPRSSST